MLKVDWVDIVEDPTWQSVAQAGSRLKCMCQSVGFFLKSDSEFLHMSSTISGSQRNSLAIPLGVIKKIKTLR